MFRWLVAAGVGLVCLGGAQAAPLEAYGALPVIDSAVISPNGQAIAYATTVDGKTRVLIHSIDDHKPLGGLDVGDQKLRDVVWAGNDNVLVTVSVTRTAVGISGPRQEFYMTQSFNLTTHKQKALLENSSESMNIVLGSPRVRTIDGDTVVFLDGITFTNHVTGVAALFMVDLTTNRTRLIQPGTERTLGWVLDDTGRIVAEKDYSETDHRWSLRLHEGVVWREVYGTDAPIEIPSVLGIGPDGNTLVLNTLEDGEWLVKQLEIADGSPGPAIDFGAGDITPVTDPATDRIIGARHVAIGIKYTFFDKADQAAWRSVADAFPDEIVDLVSWSDDRKRIIVRVDGASDGAEYYLIDQNKHSAAPLGPVYRGIEASDVAKVTPISYRAADGMNIPAYLTLPNGRAPKNLPLVVLPHGGPAARDDPGFDWWSQALAAQGYAVLQPQFRGSDGFSWKHLTAGYGEWGRKMQTDLSDGVRYLAAQGTIDPRRVCIVGASYGGYAALAGPTLDRGVYRCAVSVSGVSDPRDFLKWQAARAHDHDNRSMRFWTRFLGGTLENEARLAEISPLAHAASADAPILLIHGTDDTVVPIEQSEAMGRALQAAGKPVGFIKLDGEDHWLSRADTRLKMLQATVAFLQENNPSN
jgi:dipeptidyl aminopeptidase/acylaminoacyl peptidase